MLMLPGTWTAALDAITILHLNPDVIRVTMEEKVRGKGDSGDGSLSTQNEVQWRRVEREVTLASIKNSK
jgi:hypothetical protein